MKKLSVLVCVLGVLVLLTSSVLALEIQVAPRTLVLSSKGGNLTVHTDVPFRSVDRDSVCLQINGTIVEEEEVGLFADSCGNLVVQCGKDVVKEIVGEIRGKSVAATVKLTVNGNSDSEEIRVKQ